MPALRCLLPFCLLWLTGCATPPAAPPPTLPVPDRFREAAPDVAAVDPATVPARWWLLFDDPALDGLQSQLIIGNQNLQAAAAQVAAAQAVLAGNRAAQAPTLNATASATRSDSGVASLTRQPQNAFSVGLAAAWEVDLWGRLSGATRAGEARYQASIGDLAAARLSAQATLAQTYFALRVSQAQQAVLERSVAAYRRSLELTEHRRDAGVAPVSDVLQARIQLQDAQVQLLDVHSQQAQYEHAVAVLLGQPPAALTLDALGRGTLPPPPAAPRLLPSTLLQRRPDIAAAGQRVAAAQASAGVARTAFFPALTLSANGGLRSSALEQLAQAPTLFWSLGPAVAQRLFDGGAARAVIDQADAAVDQAAATYRQTVLTALQEVEDNLSLAARLQDEVALQSGALADARRHLAITEAQYQAGTVSFLNVVVAQVTALTAERKLLDLQLRQLGAICLLLKNTAGPW